MGSYVDERLGLNTRTFETVEDAMDFAISLQEDLADALRRPDATKTAGRRKINNLSESLRVILFLVRMELKTAKIAASCDFNV